MLIKNQEITLVIEDNGINGEGVGKYENMAVFVPYALTGETVRVKIILVKKKFAVAKLIEIIIPSQKRTEPVCPVFFRCGGCQLQHIDYGKQLKIKESNIKGCFNKIARLYPDVKPCIESNLRYNYRNKLQLPVGDCSGVVETGFYAEFSHDIVPVEKCPLHPEWADKLIFAVKEFMKAENIKAYNYNNGSGVVRHIVAKELSGKLMITLVINADKLNCDYLIESLKKLFSSDFSLYININKQQTNVVSGERYICLFGEEKLQGEFNGIKYRIGAASFMQVNNYIKDRLYGDIIDIIKKEENAVCIDAYSGAGLLAALMTKYAKTVYAIEIVPQAVNDAKELKKDNKIESKMVNICGDCDVELPKVLNEQKNNNTVLVLDPPRKGCSRAVIKAIRDCKPQSIIYISCNPATLARDLGLITGTLNIDSENLVPDETKNNNLYEITLVQPYDMFPQTKHVETLVTLTRKN